MSTKQPSKSVFVGNIPYGLTEEQIIRIFSSAGKVLNFRLVYDRETGRPKGFGFVEFPDQDSASSAVRNLNDYEIMNRKLRVDFSNDGGDDDNTASHAPAPISLPYNTQVPLSMSLPHTNGLPPPPAAANSSFPNLPTGVDLPPNLSCPDAISRTLNTLPPQQLLDVLSQMKTLATTDAAKATELLQQAPQLSYAIFQALLLMGLVSTEALGSVVEAASAPAPQPLPTRQAQYSAPPPQQSFNTGPPGYGPPPGQQQYQPPPPVVPTPQPQSQPQQQHGGQDTDALMAQVLAMPQELIDSLPPAERAQLLALRATYGR